jgi:polar amino acid transport system substrate-binding protein
LPARALRPIVAREQGRGAYLAPPKGGETLMPSRSRGIVALLAVVTMVAVACGDEPTATPSSPSAEQDLLARIKETGVLRVATDQKYKPQSWFVYDTAEWKGFDVDVANEVAARLGDQLGVTITTDIQHRDWSTDVTAGSWNDRYDMNVGSMTVTPEREELFIFAPAYYYTPASIAVHADNTTVQDVTTDLDGKKVCVGAGTTYEHFLAGTLNIEGYTIDYVIDDPTIVPFETDTDALDQLSLGDGVRCDAAMTATPTIDQYIADGGPVKNVGGPLYDEPLAIAFDRNAPIDNASLVEAVSAIIDEMHADGTLTELSQKWYKEDITDPNV